jgi:hypothetical protein
MASSRRSIQVQVRQALGENFALSAYDGRREFSMLKRQTLKFALLTFAFLCLWNSVASAKSGLDWDEVGPRHLGAAQLKSIRAVVEAWEVTDEWELSLNSAEESVYQSPTRRIGVWVEARFASDHSVRAIRIQADFSEEIIWRKNRAIEISNEVTRAEPSTKRDFTDTDLEQLVSSGKFGLIYVWGPRFPLSIETFSAFQSAATDARVPLTVLLSGESALIEARKKLSRLGESATPIRQAASFDLIRRGVEAHLPILFAYSGKRMHFRNLRGWREKSEVARWIAEEIATGK